MNVQSNYLTINPYSRCGEKLQSVKNIVIHWVGNAGSSALANRNYFESLKDQAKYASSQYIIGLQGEIIACMPEDEIAWNAGNYNINLNSIGIENCHPDWNGKFNDSTYNSLVELIVEICKRHSLDQNSIIRHYDVTKKICPKYYVENPIEFDKLKQDVANRLGNITPIIPPVLNTTTYNVGETVTYSSCYRSSTDEVPSAIILNKWQSGRITKVLAGRNNPYLIENGRCWINDGDIRSGSQPTPQPAPQVGFKVGQVVTLQGYATQYATGQNIPMSVRNKQYTIMQVGNGKVLLKEIMSWVLNQDVK